jgi:murein DD-endopeptidase MepM/ murein hydrolase activator NlpD
MKKGKKESEILFIRTGEDKPKTVSLSSKKLRWIVVISFTLIVIIIFSFAYFLSDIIYQTELSHMRKNNSRLVSTVYDLKTRLELVESELNTLVEKDRALRTYADIPAIDQDIRKLGIGGKRGLNVEELDNLLPQSDVKISDLVNDLDKLSRAMKLEKLSYEIIYDAFKNRSDQIRSTPSIRPVNSGYITDGFGYRKDPFSERREFHYGIDIAAPIGTPVYATADGVVSGTETSRGYGKVVKIDHGFGYSTVYAHLSKYLVKRGEVVTKGQKIAEVGITGRTTGPHLHYEVRQFGVHKNPLDYYFAGYIK